MSTLCMSKKNSQRELHIVCLYVDEFLFTCKIVKLVSKFKEAIIFHFVMTNVGLLSYILGIEIVQIDKDILYHRRSTPEIF